MRYKDIQNIRINGIVDIHGHHLYGNAALLYQLRIDKAKLFVEDFLKMYGDMPLHKLCN